MGKGVVYSISLSLLIGVLAVLNLAWGSVDIPFSDVCSILLGRDTIERESWRYIVWESRLPEVITAILAGASLSVSGLLLQTVFRNPLAGPDVFGITSGASLSVALVMLGMGGMVTAGDYTLGGYMAVLSAAFVGALAVTVVLFLFSMFVRRHVMLLIIGIMIGYLANSAVSLLNFFASEDGVKSYVMWGMGSFGNVSLDQIPVFLIVTLFGLLIAITLVKPLNALLLGDAYAANLGVDVRRSRHILLVVTGFLTAAATAFCGPISFIGLATPHVARMLLSSDNHRRLLPVTLLLGAFLALGCNLLCSLPGERGVLPLNVVTPLLGAPVIIYVVLRHRT